MQKKPSFVNWHTEADSSAEMADSYATPYEALTAWNAALECFISGDVKKVPKEKSHRANKCSVALLLLKDNKSRRKCGKFGGYVVHVTRDGSH